MKDNLQIPYGVSDFKRIRREGYYYIDKTGYIPLLEQAGSFLFFVRPRRFGKSLMASMLRCYYDVAEKESFDELFGGLEIAGNPTRNRNRYQVLYMDFSKIGGAANLSLQERFENYVGKQLDDFMRLYGAAYESDVREDFAKSSPADKLTVVTTAASRLGLPLYLMLDEYDNFTNQMLQAEGNNSYRDITHGQGFYRAWFKMFKGSFDRIYMTGVSPVTMDDLTSGFNIASNISQDENFNAMLGFSGEMELSRGFCDFCLFPERHRFGDVRHSYLVELKYDKSDASEERLQAQYEDAVGKLAQYRADPSVPTLARGTVLHQLVFQFKGADLLRCEQVAEEAM